MQRIVQFHLKNFNDALLAEEVASALPGRTSGFTWAGFHRLDSRRYEPNAGTEVIERRKGPGGVTTVTADPGELWIKVADDFSTAEETTLTNTLTAHDATQLTAEQQRDDQDDFDGDRLRQLLQIFLDGGSLSNAEREEGIQLLMRLILRILRGEPV